MGDTEHHGMEYFGSRPETARAVSLAEVDRSDVYVGIFGFRYGSGITEAEYRRAIERGLPCFIYFEQETDDGPAPARDAEPDKAERLAGLKRELEAAHLRTFFVTPDQLATYVATDLHRYLMQIGPAQVRAPS